MPGGLHDDSSACPPSAPPSPESFPCVPNPPGRPPGPRDTSPRTQALERDGCNGRGLVGVERQALDTSDFARCEKPWRLVERWDAGSDIDVVQHVADDEDAVRFAPVGDLSGRVSRHVEDERPATSSPSRRTLSMRWAGPAQYRRASRVMGWSGVVSAISRGSSAAAASPAGTRNGIVRAAQTSFNAPCWSGWTCVRACADTSRPLNAAGSGGRRASFRRRSGRLRRGRR